MSTDALSMEDMGAALADVTNTANNVKNEEAFALARDKGWVEPQGFDYETYNASGRATADNEALQTEWGHNAAKYEWKEEYGEVGPAVPELEQQLFRSEFLNRRGVKFEK